MNKIGIIFHPLNRAACDLASEMESRLQSAGIETWLSSAWEGDTVRARVDGTDLILTVGGDGTILRAAQAVVPHATPMTGVNMGNLGFMTELGAAEVFEQLKPILEGRGWADERALLEAELEGSTGDAHTRTLYALNDMVMARGAIARLVRIEARIDGAPLTTYKADGVIVSTATGSTGYALAAGGPILHPHAPEMLLLPIVPHLSASYSLVLPATAEVELKLVSRQPASLTVDGHIMAPLNSGAILRVRRSEHTARFLRVHADMSYYGSLESRLKGKQ